MRAIQARLESIGNSVLVGGDARMVKVHVHNERPDEVIAYGLSLGTLTRITVENLDTMADDVREARAAEFVGEGAGAGRRPRHPGRPTKAATAVAVQPAAPAAPGPARDGGRRADDEWLARPGRGEVDVSLGPAIVAVVAGEGSSGVPRARRRPHRPGRADGQPEHRRAAPDRPPRALPRGHPPAEQPERPPRRRAGGRASARTAGSSSSRPATPPRAWRRCSPSKPTLDAAANVGPMTAAGRGLATVQVTEAVRDAKIGGEKVKKGQTIALDPDDGLVAVDKRSDEGGAEGGRHVPARGSS